MKQMEVWGGECKLTSVQKVARSKRRKAKRRERRGGEGETEGTKGETANTGQAQGETNTQKCQQNIFKKHFSDSLQYGLQPSTYDTSFFHSITRAAQ